MGKQYVLVRANVCVRLKHGQRRRQGAAESKCWSVSGRCRIRTASAFFPELYHAAAGSVAFKPYLAFLPSVTPNPSFKRTASPPLNSNVGRHKEHGSESHEPCVFSQAVKASDSVPVCTGCAARKSNTYASSQAKATPSRSGCPGRWLFVQASNTRFLQPPREGLTSSIGAGAGAPSKANVSQSVGAAAQ